MGKGVVAAHRILFVCAYNVCRSPYLAATMANAVATDPKAAEWVISSRGTVGPEGAAMCDVATGRLSGEIAEFVMTHVSERVESSDVASAHLILTATREERAHLAILAPEARTKTFTLREALLLGDHPVTDQERRDVTIPGRSVASLRTYAEALNRRRGTLVELEPRRSLLRWRHPEDPLDHPDTHSEKSSRHVKMFNSLDADIATLVRQIASFAPRAKS